MAIMRNCFGLKWFIIVLPFFSCSSFSSPHSIPKKINWGKLPKLEAGGFIENIKYFSTWSNGEYISGVHLPLENDYSVVFVKRITKKGGILTPRKEDALKVFNGALEKRIWFTLPEDKFKISGGLGSFTTNGFELNADPEAKYSGILCGGFGEFISGKEAKASLFYKKKQIWFGEQIKGQK